MVLFPILLWSSLLTAENYYLLQVDFAEISDQQLAKTIKQIEALEVVQQQQLTLLPFHSRRPQSESGEQPICLSCHLSLPHRKNERKRTFLNMHSRYVACETCHLKSESTELDYRWLAYDGPHVGLEVVAMDVEGDEAKKPFMPLPGARITPFVDDKPAVIFKSAHSAKRVTGEWASLDIVSKAKLKARLHAPLQREGPACEACHNRESLLDLEMLGADSAKRRQIEQNSIARFFARFNEERERLRITDLLR